MSTPNVQLPTGKHSHSSARNAVLCGAVMVSIISAGARVAAENWPQWRGPGGQGVSKESKLPTTWGPDKNIAWKVELPGSGHSSPIIWNDRIFITAVIEGEVVTMAPLRNRRPAGEEILVSRIAEGFTRFTWNGETGYGMTEYIERIEDGKLVGYTL